jgi:hypothetical protein
MEEGNEIELTDPRDEIVRLEAHIEALAAIIENCRKFILASRASVALGGLLLLAGMVGVISLDPALLTAAIVAVIGGIVLLGSNSSTAKEAAAEMVDAEARRAELIGHIDLRVIRDGVKES